MQYLDKNYILDSLTKDDIIKICNLLGSPQYKQDNNGNPCFCTSICHGGDSPYKLIYYHDPKEENGRHHGFFKCYTCGDSYDIVELVIRAMRQQGKTYTWYKALRWIAQVTGKLAIASSTEKVEITNVEDFSWIDRLRSAQKKRAIPNLSEINENILEIFCYIPHEEWLKDHITSEALGRFDIGYYGLTNQITIPHFDSNNRLIGIRGRYLDKIDIDLVGKYAPLQIEGKWLSHQLGSNLYGIHVTKDAILRKKKIMLVEAEKSVLQCYSYFGEDSFTVATCGSAITATQIKIILKELQVNEVLYAPDRDYHEADSFEAEVWWQKQIKKLAPLIPYVKVCLVADRKDRLNFKDSPTDQGKEVLLELLDEKIVITTEDLKGIKTNE
jgi:hypothetical protein